MRNKFLKLVSFLTGFFLVPVSYVADANNSAWQFDVAPYIWAMNLHGSATNGPFTAKVSESFSELMKYFDSGGMLWIDGYKGPIGIFVNGLYSNLSDHEQEGPLNAKLKIHFGIVSAGVSYIILQKPWGLHARAQLEPYVGARYTFNNINLKLNQLSAASDQDWTDPIFGVRLRNDFNSHWSVTVSGDVGVKNTNTQYSYNLVGLVGYKPTLPAFDNDTFYLGYRYLYQFYEHGVGIDFFKWKMKLFGPMLGVNFNF